MRRARRRFRWIGTHVRPVSTAPIISSVQYETETVRALALNGYVTIGIDVSDESPHVTPSAPRGPAAGLNFMPYR